MFPRIESNQLMTGVPDTLESGKLFKKGQKVRFFVSMLKYKQYKRHPETISPKKKTDESDISLQFLLP